MDRSVCKSTTNSYKRHVAKYMEFCKHLGVPSIKEEGNKSVELWLASLSKKGLSYPTIVTHLSALRHMAKKEGLSTNCESNKIHLMLKGLKNAHTPNKKNPVTLSQLKRLTSAASALDNRLERAQFRSLITLAFFGFLRPSEMFPSTGAHQLKIRDVKVASNNKSCQIVFRSFKHSKGTCSIKIEETPEQALKPVTLLRHYLSLLKRNNQTEPLYALSLRDFRRTLDTMCQQGKIKTFLTPHCFRHGGATWASNQGWSETKIKAHGRWKSNAYSSYIRSY